MTNARCGTLVVGFLLAGLALVSAAERTRYDRTFYEPSEAVVTPHLVWQKPMAGGKLRVLFITHRNAMREAIELAQRFDLDYRVFACESPTKFGETGMGVDAAWRLVRGNSAEELAEQLRRDLATAVDVIVLGNVKWDELPLDCRYEILRKVKAGTGLVGHLPAGRDEYINRLLQDRRPNPGFENPGPAPVDVVSAVPFAALPAFAAQADAASFAANTLETATFGRGRLAFLRASVPIHQMLTPGPTGRVQDCRLDYDYYLALAGKLIRWGAGRTPAVTVASPPEPRATRARAELAATPLTFRLNAATAPGGIHLDFCLRDRHNRIWSTARRDLELAAGETAVNFSLPPLPRGSYFADLWVQKDGATVDFGSQVLEVTDPLGLAKVTLAQESVARGEALSGTVGIDGFIPGLTLRLRATDGHGRRLAEQTQPVTAAELPFSLPMTAALTLVGRLEAELLQGADSLDVEGLDIHINNLYPDRQDALFVMWESYANDFIGPLIAESFTANGIEAQYGGAGAPGYGPYANQWWLPYAIRFTDSKTDWYQERISRQAGDLVRDPCLTDPAYRKTVRETLQTTALAARNCSTSDFTLGDENLFVSGAFDLCFSPTCNADFTRWLKEHYADLATLNAAWGTAYASWDEARPQTLEDARKAGNLAPWVAHRRHMDSVWAGIHAFGRDVIRETVPAARVGYEGSDSQVSTYLAADYWKLAQSMNLNNIYYRDFLSLAWRDFAPPGMLLGAGWFGGYPDNRNEPFMRWFPWRTLFKGSNSFWVWCGYGNAGSVMAFDLSPYPFFQAACTEVAAIKGGPGKLLITADRAHDGIAVLYSATSVHVATATAGFPDLDLTLNATVQLLHDVGLECRILSYEQVAAGQLTNREFRLLVLPGAQALSRPEADAVRRFVEAGGAVLADLRPGVADENGRPYAKGALDDVFGVTQAPSFKGGPAELLTAALANLTCDATLTLAGGTAAGQAGPVPLLVSKAFGQGQATLLNFALMPYGNLPKAKDADFADWAAGAGWRAFLRQQVSAAGVRTPVRVEPELPHLEVARFRRGDLEYVGIIQSLPRPAIDYTNQTAAAPTATPVHLTFDREAYVYDVRSGGLVGRTDTVKTAITPGEAKLYALLPYRVTALGITAPRRADPGLEIALGIAVKVKGNDTPGRHVVRVEFADPAGRPVPYYAQNVLCDAGKGELRVTFALNDSPGTWTLTARDTATGVTRAAGLRLEGE
jgi:hypothetical protein